MIRHGLLTESQFFGDARQPPKLTQIALPALTLTSSSGATLQVGEWPLSIGPATPANPFNAGPGAPDVKEQHNIKVRDPESKDLP